MFFGGNARRSVIAGATAVGLALSAVATGHVRAETEAAPVTLRDTEVRSLTSRDGARSYRLLIGRPAGEAPPGGFPVLYLLDGNGTFATAFQAMRLQSRRPDISAVEPMVIVGIAHDDGADGPFNVPLRYRDYTPASPDGAPKRKPGWPNVPRSGEAERFADFLIDEVRPAIADIIPIDPARQSLFGHSLGGLFALHVAATRPGAFRNLIAASPSVWWDDERVLGEIDRIGTGDGKADAPAPRVLVLVGARETPDMRAGAMAATDHLARSPLAGLEAWFEMADHADHITILPTALNRALRFASGASPTAPPGREIGDDR